MLGLFPVRRRRLDRTTTSNAVQEHIKEHAKESKKFVYTVILVPRVSPVVSKIFEEQGVLGDVTITSYNLQFIPLAPDLISLENDRALRDVWVVSHGCLRQSIYSFTPVSRLEMKRLFTTQWWLWKLFRNTMGCSPG